MDRKRLAMEIVDEGELPARLKIERIARFCRSDAPGGGISNDDLAVLNEYALRSLTPADVIVRDARIANNMPDSYNTQFTENALEKIVKLMPGAPVMRNHVTYGVDGLPVGRWFRCWNERDEDGTYWTAARMYMLREPLTDSLALRMDGGVLSEVSLSWWMSREAMRCSICGRIPLSDGCEHFPGEDYNGRKCVTQMLDVDEVDEGSLVWKGGQYNTKIMLADGDDDEDDVTSSRFMLVQRLARRAAHRKSAAPAVVDPMQAWWDANRPAGSLQEWFHNAG